MKFSYLYSVFLLVGTALTVPVGGPGEDPAAAGHLPITDARINDFINKIGSGEIPVDNNAIHQYWTGQSGGGSQVQSGTLLDQAGHIPIVDIEQGQEELRTGITRATVNGQHVKYKLWLDKEDFAAGPGTEGPSGVYQGRNPGQYLPNDGSFARTTMNGAFALDDQLQLKLTQAGMNKISSYTLAIKNHADANGIGLGHNSWSYTLNFDPSTIRPSRRSLHRKDLSPALKQRDSALTQINSQVSQPSAEASTTAVIQSLLLFYTQLQSNATTALLPFIEQILTSNNTLLHSLLPPLYGMVSSTTLMISSPFAPGLNARQYDSFDDTQAKMKAEGNYSSTQLNETASAANWLRAELDTRWDEAEKVVNSTGQLVTMRNLQLYFSLLDLKSNGTSVFPGNYYQAQTDATLDSLLKRVGR